MNDLIYTNPTEIFVPSDWQILSIEALCERVTSGATPSRAESKYYQGGTIPWFKTKELGSLQLIDSEEKITDAAIRETSAKLFPPGTVLMAMYGDGKTITSLGILEVEAATNQACCAMIPNPKVCDSRFLYYSLSRYKQDFLQIANGGAQRNLSGALIKNFCIGAPHLFEQKAIAHILGTLDDKIELNRKTNETLEGIAKALFKSWFVDFDPVRAKAEGRPTGLPDEISELFPDSFEESELGEIPSGWTICPLGELSSIFSGKRPTSVFDSRTPQAPYPLFGGAGIMGYTNESLIENRLVITTGRVGTLGKFHRIKEAVWVSDNALIIEPDKSIYHHVLHALINVDISAMNRGSTQPLITQKDLKSIEILKGSVLIHELFEGLCGGIFNAIDCRGRESSVLSELRDALLPRLISGELRVPDAEKMLEEVGI